MIDPGRLADAAAMRARDARDRLTSSASGFGFVNGPMHKASAAEIDASLDEIREAFIAGAKWSHDTETASEAT